jgi:hypothetical protein
MISKLVSGIIYKNFGYKVIVSLEDLNVNFEDGDTTIKTKVELKMDKEEYIKVIKKVDRF